MWLTSQWAIHPPNQNMSYIITEKDVLANPALYQKIEITTSPIEMRYYGSHVTRLICVPIMIVLILITPGLTEVGSRTQLDELFGCGIILGGLFSTGIFYFSTFFGLGDITSSLGRVLGFKALLPIVTAIAYWVFALYGTVNYGHQFFKICGSLCLIVDFITSSVMLWKIENSPELKTLIVPQKKIAWRKKRECIDFSGLSNGSSYDTKVVDE